MGDLSKHFNRKEFACKCGKCTAIAVDKELLDVLEDIRTHFGKPLIITSSHRCEEHNRNVGGSDNSMHLTGKAADIQLLGVEPSKVQAYALINYPDQYGIGSYSTFTHVDVRDYKARW